MSNQNTVPDTNTIDKNSSDDDDDDHHHLNSNSNKNTNKNLNSNPVAQKEKFKSVAEAVEALKERRRRKSLNNEIVELLDDSSSDDTGHEESRGPTRLGKKANTQIQSQQQEQQLDQQESQLDSLQQTNEVTSLISSSSLSKEKSRLPNVRQINRKRKIFDGNPLATHDTTIQRQHERLYQTNPEGQTRRSSGGSLQNAILLDDSDQHSDDDHDDNDAPPVSAHPVGKNSSFFHAASAKGKRRPSYQHPKSLKPVSIHAQSNSRKKFLSSRQSKSKIRHLNGGHDSTNNTLKYSRQVRNHGTNKTGFQQQLSSSPPRSQSIPSSPSRYWQPLQSSFKRRQSPQRSSRMTARTAIRQFRNQPLAIGRGREVTKALKWNQTSLDQYRTAVDLTNDTEDEKEDSDTLSSGQNTPFPEDLQSTSDEDDNASEGAIGSPIDLNMNAEMGDAVIDLLDSEDDEVPMNAFADTKDSECASASPIFPASLTSSQISLPPLLDSSETHDKPYENITDVTKDSTLLKPNSRTLLAAQHQDDESARSPHLKQSAPMLEESQLAFSSDEKGHENACDFSIPETTEKVHSSLRHDGASSEDERSVVVEDEQKAHAVPYPNIIPPMDPLTFDQLQQLLQPPPMMRPMDPKHPECPESFRSLLSSTSEKSQWLLSVESRGGNALEEWELLGSRLRQWQVRQLEDEKSKKDDLVEETLSRTPHNGQSGFIEEIASSEMDNGFKGGVDKPIDGSRENEELEIMRTVPMFEEKAVDKETGLPIRKFAVVDRNDCLLYKFQLHVRKSSIPNAGNGAFLRLLSIKELKPSQKKRRSEIERLRPSRRDPYDNLHARLPQGTGIRVHLRGDHLKHRYNSQNALPNLKAKVPIRGHTGHTRTVLVKFTDPDLPYDEDEIYGLKNPLKRIGHFGLMTENDYVEAPRRTFSSLHPQCGYIDIGRYGPFTRKDRKSEHHFEIKAFLFGFEPNMWGFGVTENISGAYQMIDITDDATGEPHDIAKQNIPMHVNEVGHNPLLQETIHAREVDERIIQYYVRIVNPMKTGDEFELFVNYDSHYEANRERKGYGKKNINGEEKDDSHFPTRLRRNIPERQAMQMSILEVTALSEIAALLDFCGEIALSLYSVLDKWVGGEKKEPVPLSLKQLVAIRRLEWIVDLFSHRFDSSENFAFVPGLCDDFFRFQIDEIFALNFSLRRWPIILELLDDCPALKDNRGENILIGIHEEMFEEICFEVQDVLLLPIENSRWCPIGAETIDHLCSEASKFLLKSRDGDRQALVDSFLEIALISANEIRDTTDISRLAFTADFEDPFVVNDANSNDAADHTSSISASQNMIVSDLLLHPNDKVGKENCLFSLRGRLSQSTCETKPNVTWYIARQICFATSAIANVIFKGDPIWSLENLWKTVGLDPFTGNEALTKPMVPRQDGVVVEEQSALTENQKKRKKKKKGKAKDGCALNGKVKTAINKPLFWEIIWSTLKNKLGWTIIHGNRPNDIYLLPPGVVRGQRRFKNRVHFFDSVLQVMNVLVKSPQWATNEEVKRCLAEYNLCRDLYNTLKQTKKLPAFDDRLELIAWLRKTVKTS